MWSCVVVRKHCAAAGATRNHGVDAAQGDVIFFGEADDVFYEHHVPVCWDEVLSAPALCVVTVVTSMHGCRVRIMMWYHGILA